MRRGVLLVLFGALWLGLTPAEAPASPEAEYLVLQAGVFDAATFRPPDEAVQSLDRALLAVRQQFPETREIRFTPPGTSIILQLTAPAAAQVCTRGLGSQPAALGLPDVDATTARLGAGYRLSCAGSRLSVLTVNTPALLHVPSVVRLYRSAPSVRAVFENELIGGGTAVTARWTGGEWSLGFTRGWGDCLAGCIHRETFTFSVAADGTVRKTGESRR